MSHLVEKLVVWGLGPVSWIVPKSQRKEWRDEWSGEVLGLFGLERPTSRIVILSLGAIPDAWSLREASLARFLGSRRAFLLVLRDSFLLAVRALRQSPGFTLFTVLVLAIGVGANTAIFSLARDALLGPLPFPESDRLVQVWERRPEQGRDRNVASLPDFADWRQQSRAFSALTAVRGVEQNVAGGTRPEPVFGARVTEDFLSVVRVEPILGRDFLPEEVRPPGQPVVILGHGFWTDSFGEDPAVVGRTLTLDLVTHTIVGVMPSGFDFPSGARFWVPLRDNPVEASRGSHGLTVFGRLGDGVTVEGAWDDLGALSLRLEETYPATNAGHYTAVYPLRDEMLGNTRSSVLLLLGGVGFVLLIACVNVANLQLARSRRRARGLAVRASLGASRQRLIGQALMESCVLALLAGALSIAVATGIRPLLDHSAAARVPWASSGPWLDPTVLAASLVLSLACAVLFGLAPALHASRVDPAAVLGEGSTRTGNSGAARRWQGALVIAQMALALMVVTGASLFARNVSSLARVELGFETENVLTADISLPPARYGEAEQRLAFYRDVEGQLKGTPGVEAAASAWLLPLSDRNVGRNFIIDGRPVPTNGDELSLRLRAASPDYFETLGIRTARGRGLESADSEDSPAVAVASETLVRHYWPEEDPIGQRIAWGPGMPWITIVGVVEDVRHSGPAYPAEPELYLPMAQSPPQSASFVIRGGVPAESLAAGVRAAVEAVDPDQPVARVRLLEETLGVWLGRQRALAGLSGAFALSALLLAVMGVYGVVSYGVGLRTREFGIRLAVGGGPSAVLGAAMSEGARLVLVGLALGALGALAVAGLMEGLLEGVSPYDPASLAGALTFLGAVGLAGVLIPAYAATRVDPLSSLGSG